MINRCIVLWPCFDRLAEHGIIRVGTLIGHYKTFFNLPFVMSQLAQEGPPFDIRESMEVMDGRFVVFQQLVASLTFNIFNLSTFINTRCVFQMACNGLTTSHLVAKKGLLEHCQGHGFDSRQGNQFQERMQCVLYDAFYNF